jgi:hypothetical protein
MTSGEYHETLSMVHALSLGCKSDSGSGRVISQLPTVQPFRRSASANEHAVLQNERSVGSDDILTERRHKGDGTEQSCLRDVQQATEVLQDIEHCICNELMSVVCITCCPYSCPNSDVMRAQ